MDRIGLMTSGGDSPGMNAAVRGVVRAALGRGTAVTGFLHGWQGVIDNECFDMDSTTVGGIIAMGGTILRTARSNEFRTPEGRSKALGILQSSGVEGLVVIGGDGSLTGRGPCSKNSAFP